MGDSGLTDDNSIFWVLTIFFYFTFWVVCSKLPNILLISSRSEKNETPSGYGVGTLLWWRMNPCHSKRSAHLWGLFLQGAALPNFEGDAVFKRLQFISYMHIWLGKFCNINQSLGNKQQMKKHMDWQQTLWFSISRALHLCSIRILHPRGHVGFPTSPDFCFIRSSALAICRAQFWCWCMSRVDGPFLDHVAVQINVSLGTRFTYSCFCAFPYALSPRNCPRIHLFILHLLYLSKSYFSGFSAFYFPLQLGHRSWSLGALPYCVPLS